MQALWLVKGENMRKCHVCSVLDVVHGNKHTENQFIKYHGRKTEFIKL